MFICEKARECMLLAKLGDGRICETGKHYQKHFYAVSCENKGCGLRPEFGSVRCVPVENNKEEL